VWVGCYFWTIASLLGRNLRFYTFFQCRTNWFSHTSRYQCSMYGLFSIYFLIDWTDALQITYDVDTLYLPLVWKGCYWYNGVIGSWISLRSYRIGLIVISKVRQSNFNTFHCSIFYLFIVKLFPVFNVCLMHSSSQIPVWKINWLFCFALLLIGVLVSLWY